MASVFLASYLALSMLLVIDGSTLQEDLFERLDKHSIKRSGGLLADMVNLLVEEKREREVILEENKAMKTSLGETKKRLDNAVADLKKKCSRQFKDTQKQLDTAKQSFTAHVKESSIRFNGVQTQLSAINKPGNGSINRQGMIGFHALLFTEGHFAGILKFLRLELNEGERYDATTGKFTCNKPGLYIFNVYFATTTTGAYVDLRKDGSFLARAHASYDDDKGAWDSSSISVVVKLDVGDEVWVNGTAYFNNASYFSGALIRALK